MSGKPMSPDRYAERDAARITLARRVAACDPPTIAAAVQAGIGSTDVLRVSVRFAESAGVVRRRRCAVTSAQLVEVVS